MTTDKLRGGVVVGVVAFALLLGWTYFVVPRLAAGGTQGA